MSKAELGLLAGAAILLGVIVYVAIDRTSPGPEATYVAAGFDRTGPRFLDGPIGQSKGAVTIQEADTAANPR